MLNPQKEKLIKETLKEASAAFKSDDVHFRMGYLTTYFANNMTSQQEKDLKAHLEFLKNVPRV